MSISFSGLASGMPVNDIVQQLMAIDSIPMQNMQMRVSQLNTQKTYMDFTETRVRSLNSSLQKFTDASLASSLDIFSNKTVTSSDEAKLQATANNTAANQTLSIDVLEVASATTVSSMGAAATTGNVGSVVDGTTLISDLANGTGTTGTFSVYYDGNAHEITVEDGDTVNDVLSDISNINGGGSITASITGGKITLASTGGQGIFVGASGDTSNFLKATQLDVAAVSGNDLISANSLSGLQTDGTLSDNAANMNTTVTEGTFTIGEATFTIDSTTTMDSLISQINNDQDAKVTASYNLRTNKLELTSKDAGKTAITLGSASDTSNFLSATNLVNGANTLAYQDLGNNSKIQINGGPEIESTSNIIDDSVTGIKGVTLEISNQTTDPIELTIEQDTEALVTALDEFISDFNEVISYIDAELDPDKGKLAGDSSLKRLRDTLISRVTDIVGGAELTSVSQIGITTGEVGNTDSPSSKLTINKTTLNEKLLENPNAIKELLIGDDDKGITGVFENLKSITDSALDPVNGLFAARDDSIDRQISSMNDSITRTQARLDMKEANLMREFNAMEKAISTLQSQSGYMSSQLGF